MRERGAGVGRGFFFSAYRCPRRSHFFFFFLQNRGSRIAWVSGVGWANDLFKMDI